MKRYAIIASAVLLVAFDAAFRPAWPASGKTAGDTPLPAGLPTRLPSRPTAASPVAEDAFSSADVSPSADHPREISFTGSRTHSVTDSKLYSRKSPVTARTTLLSKTLKHTSAAQAPEIPGPLPQPAAWVELPDSPHLTTEQQQEIQENAEALLAKIEGSGFEPGSPEYRAFWNEAVNESDRTFRQRYGAQAWMQHHIQAHHLGHPPDQ